VAGVDGRAGLTPRLLARIRKDFPADADRVVAMIDDLAGDLQVGERVLAAVVVMAKGDLERLRSEIDLARTDWRDTLMGTGLETDGWEDVLDRWLGPA
jgi:hypothetical protein